MPTKLAFKANYINQRIGQVICPFYYVSWDYNKLEWKYENINFRRMWPYYIAQWLSILNMILFFATIPFLGKINKNTTVSGLFVLTVFLLLLVDYLFIVNGREWVYATNWMHHHEGIYQPKRNFNFPKQLTLQDVLHALARVFAGI